MMVVETSGSHEVQQPEILTQPYSRVVNVILPHIRAASCDIHPVHSTYQFTNLAISDSLCSVFPSHTLLNHILHLNLYSIDMKADRN